MRGDIITTVVGNLTDDPELRFTSGGLAVASFTVAVNKRNYNKQAGEWEDGQINYVRVAAWRQLAENAAASLQRGDRIIAHGTFSEERWETREGDKRSAWKLTAEAIGPELSWTTAVPKRAQRGRNQEYEKAANNS